jgi:hypothetical protein
METTYNDREYELTFTQEKKVTRFVNSIKVDSAKVSTLADHLIANGGWSEDLDWEYLGEIDVDPCVERLLGRPYNDQLFDMRGEGDHPWDHVPAYIEGLKRDDDEFIAYRMIVSQELWYALNTELQDEVEKRKLAETALSQPVVD